ncbi:S1C family serine protease [Pseudomonas sp. Pse1]|uniref:S1C family serine protease n=1 Tax=Pseudomonas sp. Pse1 TaxID=2926020 RepID=UPI003564F832
MKPSFPLLFLLIAPLSGCILDPITMVGDTMTTAMMAAGPSDEERKAEDDARLLPILVAEDRKSSCDILTSVWPETRAYLLENSPVGAVAVQAREQVIAEKGCVVPSPRAQATAQAQPGDVVGVNKQAAAAPSSAVSVTTGSALSTNTLPLPSATPPSTGSLGVHVTPITPRIISAFGLPTSSGALVLGTISGGSAEKAGFQAGDVIIGISGMQVENPNELASITAKLTPGSTTSVRIWRYREAMDVAVTISASPNSQ